MSILGDNFVKLVGQVKYRSVSTYDNGSSLFKANIAVPSHNEPGKFQYIKVSMWSNDEEALLEIKNDKWIRIMGHIEEKSYSSKCRYCQGPDKKYWTDVVIDNYIILGGECE